MRRNKKLWQRISSDFFWDLFRNSTDADEARAWQHGLRRRFPAEFFENAIELRERLKSNCERDLTDPKIDVMQKSVRFFEASTRNALDKICVADLLGALSNGMITIANNDHDG